MKKEDVRASLSRIKPDEALIALTLDNIEKQRERSERRSSFFNVSYRLATAMCALVVVICVGFLVGKGGLLTTENKDGYYQSPFTVNEVVNDSARALEDEATADESDNAEEAIAALLSRAEGAEGAWHAYLATLDGIYFSPSNESGDTVCLVTLRIERLLALSEGLEATSEESIIVSVPLEEASLVDLLVNAIGERVCVRAYVPDSEGDNLWQIADIEVCQ